MKYLLFVVVFLCNISMAASYSVKVKGKTAGKATLSFTERGQRYEVQLALYPIALAKMFGIDDMIESVTGTISQGRYFPNVYQRQTIDGKSLLKVAFSGRQANIESKKVNTQRSIHLLGQDPLSQIAQIKHDLSQNKVAQSYYLVTENSQREYLAKLQRTAASYQVTLAEKNTGDRVLNLWFDEQLDLQRMEKRKRGKSDFDMVRIEK